MRVFSKEEPIGNVHFQKQIIGNALISECYKFTEQGRKVVLKYAFEFPPEHLESLINELLLMGFEEVDVHARVVTLKAADSRIYC